MVHMLAEEIWTKEYLDNLESKLSKDKLDAWRLEEAKWKENIKHIEVDRDDFERLKSSGHTKVSLCTLFPSLTWH